MLLEIFIAELGSVYDAILTQNFSQPGDINAQAKLARTLVVVPQRGENFILTKEFIAVFQKQSKKPRLLLRHRHEPVCMI